MSYGYHVITIRVLVGSQDIEQVRLDAESMEDGVPDSEDFLLLPTEVKSISDAEAESLMGS